MLIWDGLVKLELQLRITLYRDKYCESVIICEQFNIIGRMKIVHDLPIRQNL